MYFKVEPKWKDPDLFVVNELHGALDLDALSTSHPISIKVNNPDEINDIFDRISYSKGKMKHFISINLYLHLNLPLAAQKLSSRCLNHTHDATFPVR